MAKNRYSDQSGPTQRQLRVGELVRRRLAEVLSRGEVHDPELNAIPITVGEVRTTPDLKVATAHVLPLGGDNRDEALSILRRNRVEIRRAVSKGLNLKFAPEVRFEIDETFDRMDATRRLFGQDNVKRDLTGDEDA
ncbi:MAG: 30S ribosome-binding factor RbfA [Rhodobacteraceae bacterium]|nr:30S ribosome-binding factor RbfA [Paracoccaceae bacterium]